MNVIQQNRLLVVFLQIGLQVSIKSQIQFKMDLECVIISEREVEFLRSPGSSLVDFKTNPETLFPDNRVLSFITELQGVGTKRIKTLPQGDNNILRVFYFSILKEMFGLRHYSGTLMRRFKSLLYKEEANLTAIRPAKGLENTSSRQMKKLIVEFLHLVAYSKQGSRVQICLDRYPIIDKIMLVFMRTLLIGRVHKAQSFHQQIDPFFAYPVLSSMFQIDVNATEGYIQLFEGNYHIIQDQHNIHMVFFQQRIVESVYESPIQSPYYDKELSLSSLRRHQFDATTPCFDQLTPNSAKFRLSFRKQDRSMFDKYAENNADFFIKEKDEEDRYSFEAIDQVENQKSELSLISDKKKNNDQKNGSQLDLPSKISQITEEKPVTSTRKASLGDSDITLADKKRAQKTGINRIYYQQMTERFDITQIQAKIDNINKKSTILAQYQTALDKTKKQPQKEPLKQQPKEPPIKEQPSLRNIHSTPETLSTQSLTNPQHNTEILKSKFRISFQYKPLKSIPILLKPQPSVRMSYDHKTASASKLDVMRNGITIPANDKQSTPPRHSSPVRKPKTSVLTVPDSKYMGIPSTPDAYNRRVSRSPRSPKQMLDSRQFSQTSLPSVLFSRKVVTTEQPGKLVNMGPQFYQYMRL